MEEVTSQQFNSPCKSSSNMDFLTVTCNWEITNNKNFHDAVTTTMSSPNSEKTNFNDVVSLDTCISLQPSQCCEEPCMLHVKVKNIQRISRIAIVSEADVVEYFKDYGEYNSTVFAQFIDNFQDNLVYFAEEKIAPSSEIGIKFIRTGNKRPFMWVYGIQLFLTEPVKDNFYPEIFDNFLTKLKINNKGENATNGIDAFCKNIINLSKLELIEKNERDNASSNNESIKSNNVDITAYTNKKFQDLEARIMKRIDEMEQRTNEKLDIVLKHLKHSVQSD